MPSMLVAFLRRRECLNGRRGGGKGLQAGWAWVALGVALGMSPIDGFIVSDACMRHCARLPGSSLKVWMPPAKLHHRERRPPVKCSRECLARTRAWGGTSRLEAGASSAPLYFEPIVLTASPITRNRRFHKYSKRQWRGEMYVDCCYKWFLKQPPLCDAVMMCRVGSYLPPRQ